MPDGNVSIRVGLEGDAEVKAKHGQLGETGQQAFNAIKTSADATTAATDNAGAAVDRLTARNQKLALVAQQQAAVDRAQSNLRAAQTVNLANKSAEDSAAVFKAAADAEDDYARRATALRAAIDPVGAAQLKLNAAIGSANDLLAAGKISQAEHTAALALAKTAFADVEKAAKGAAGGYALSAMQISELGAVAHRSIDSIAAGANPLRILTTEGARLGVALGSGPTGAAGALKLLTSPIALAAAGFIAVAGAIIGLVAIEQSHEAQEAKLATAIRFTGVSSGITAQQIDQLAKSHSNLSGETLSAARDVAVTMATIGGVSQQQLPAATALVRHYAAAVGEELPQASVELAKAFADPAKGAAELNDKLHFLTAAQEDHIRSLAEQGDRIGAVNALIQALDVTVGQATPHMGLFASVGHAIHVGWDEAADSVGEFLRKVSGAASADPTKALQEAQKSLDYLKSLHDTQPQVMAEIAKQEERIAAAQAKIQEATSRSGQLDASRNSAALAAAFKSLDPEAAQIEQKLGAIKQMRAALADSSGAALAAIGKTRDQAQAAIVQGDKEIAQLQKRSQMVDRHAQTLAREAVAQEAAAKASFDVAAAYAQGDIDGERLELRRKAIADATKKGIDVEAQYRRDLATYIGDQAVAGAKAAAAANAQADTQDRLNGAVAAGALSADQAAKQLAIENQLRPLTIAYALAEGDARTKLGVVIDNERAALERLNASQANAQLLTGVRASNDRIAQLKLEAQYAGDLTGAREKLLAVLQLEQSSAYRGSSDDRVQAVATITALATAQQELDTRRAQYTASTLRDLQNSTALTSLELGLVGKTADERDLEVNRLQRIQALLANGVDLNSDEAKAILDQGKNLDILAAKLRVANDNWNEFKSFGDQVLGDVLNPQNWTNWKDAGRAAVTDIENEFVKLALLNPLKNALFGESNPTSSSMGGVLGSLFGGGSGYHFDLSSVIPDAGGMTNFVPGLASGSQYASGGITLVGEEGAELYQVGQGARVTPAAATRKLMQQAANDVGGGLTLNMPITLNAQGAGPREVDQLRAEVMQLKASLPSTIVGVVNDGLQRRAIRA